MLTSQTVRLIHSTDPETKQEMVTFTDDFSTPTEDFLPYGSNLEFEGLIEMELPSAFPLNHELVVKR